MTQNNNGDAPTYQGQATPQSFNPDSIISQNSSSPQLGRKKSGITEVSKSESCPHCGKPDWCYFIDELSVCNRDAEPGPGWKATSKRDRDGHTFYAPIEPHESTNKRANLRIVSTPPKKYKPAPLPKGEIVLAEFPEQPETPPVVKKGLNTEIIYPYSSTQWIQRIDYYDLAGNRTKKTTKPWHINADGKTVNSKGDQPWPIYRLSEVKQLAVGKWLLSGEGEKVVEIIRFFLRMLCTTWMGSGWVEATVEQDLTVIKNDGVNGLVYIQDNDPAGRKKAEMIANTAAKVQFPCIIVDPLELWDKMPEKGDIYDWIMAHPDWTREDFIKRMNLVIGITASRISQGFPDKESDDFDNDSYYGDGVVSELTFCQLSYRQLYLNNYWICVVDSLYKWEGNYYRKVSDGEEIARIAAWCNSYSIITQRKQKSVSIHPYANTSCVTQALKWAKQILNKHLSLLNPPGLNCLNGVLQILWDGDKPSWQLLPHSPDYYYTYPPLVEYNPSADSSHCDRLLSALDAPQRDIFLKVIAASLDLHTVRRYKGRIIRALLLLGNGSNGKDALRTAVSTIYGKYGLTSVTLDDFNQYDSGRKFSLSCLYNSRINWASENTDTSRLDRIQSLKAAITGSPLVCESKGKDGIEFDPLTIFLFNINDTPRLKAVMEAILTRFGVLTFNKTFKIAADPTKGEIEADPRFTYDPLFLQFRVCPALLNRMLQALVDLMANGIDYRCTQEALEDIQAENSHLFRFAQDTGLTYSLNSYLSAAEIWEKLEQWYLENGTLVYEETSNGKKKAIWADQPRMGDYNIKAVNQVLARFKQMFPKTKLGVATHSTGKRNVSVLYGITFDLDKSIFNKRGSIATIVSSTSIPPQLPDQQTPINQDSHTTHINLPNSEETQKSEFSATASNNLILKDDEFVCDNDSTSITEMSMDVLDSPIDINPNLLTERSENVERLWKIKVEGVIANIRELIALNADWGKFQQYFAPIDEKLKKEAFQHLLSHELQILITLQPIDEEQRKAKEFIDSLKSGQNVDLKLNQAIASLNQEEKDNLFKYLPREYRNLLRPD